MLLASFMIGLKNQIKKTKNKSKQSKIKATDTNVLPPPPIKNHTHKSAQIPLSGACFFFFAPLEQLTKNQYLRVPSQPQIKREALLAGLVRPPNSPPFSSVLTQVIAWQTGYHNLPPTDKGLRLSVRAVRGIG